MEQLLFKSHPSAVIDEGCHIGEGTAIWHFSHLTKGCIVGRKCSIGQGVFIAGGVIVGNNVKIQNNVSLFDGVVCEDDVFLGPSVVFTNVINPRSAIPRKDQYRKTFVKRGASIGANATVLCGITIGKYAMIGAGAVVTSSLPDYALAFGNPAKQKGWVSEYGHTLEINANGEAVCIESGEKYKMQDGAIRKIN